MLRQQLRGRWRISDLCGGQPLYLRKERTTTNGIKGWRAGQRSHLGSKGTLNKNLYKIFRGRITKPSSQNSQRIAENKEIDLVER
jgi:hypothetical protein